MKAKKLEDLQIYQKALEGVAAVSPLLQQLRDRKDFELYNQLSESSGNIPGHIAEGFGQLTDKHFAHYLGIRARLSTGDARASGERVQKGAHFSERRNPRFGSLPRPLQYADGIHPLSSELRFSRPLVA
jgi:hypothetical protein